MGEKNLDAKYQNTAILIIPVIVCPKPGGCCLPPPPPAAGGAILTNSDDFDLTAYHTAPPTSERKDQNSRDIWYIFIPNRVKEDEFETE